MFTVFYAKRLGIISAIIGRGRWQGLYHSNPFTCDFCAYDLEQKFMKMKGVNGFDVNIDELFFIKKDGSLNLDEVHVKKMLLENGFDFKSMKEKVE